jgi:hypothetical protein
MAAHRGLCVPPAQKAKKERYRSFMGKFGRAQVQDVLSACFISAGTLVTGAPSGELLMWDVTGTRTATGQFGCCIKVRGVQRVRSAAGPHAQRHARPAMRGGGHALGCPCPDSALLRGPRCRSLQLTGPASRHPASTTERSCLRCLCEGRSTRARAQPPARSWPC